MTFRIKNEDCRPHANDLEKSLTSMDWLPRLNVRAISQAANQETGINGHKHISYTTIRDVADETSRDGKPPFSYANLITLAINSSASNKMTLSEIYVWIAEKFPFYKSAGTGWKNSIRHNLSLNKCFAKVPRSKDDPGKGSYWSVVSNPTPDDALGGNRGTKRKRYPNTFQINAPTAQNPPPLPQSDTLFFNSHQQNNSNNHHREDEEKYSYPFKRQTTPTSTTSNDSGSSSSTVNNNPAADRPDSSSSNINSGLSHLDLVDLSESFKSIYQQIFEQASRVPAHPAAGEPHSSGGVHASTSRGFTASKGELQAIKTEDEVDSSYQQQHHHSSAAKSPSSVREYLSSAASSSSSSHQYVAANNAMIPGHQHENQHMTLNEINKSLTNSANLSSSALQGFEGFNSSIDSLRQSCNKLKSFDLSGIDLSQFQDLFDNMQQAEENDWNVDADLAVDLCSSLNRFVSTHHVTSAPSDHVTASPRQPPPPYDHPHHMIQAGPGHPASSSVTTGSSESKGSFSHQNHTESHHQHQQYLHPQRSNSQHQMVGDRRGKTTPIPSAQPPQFQTHQNQHHHNDSEDFYDSFDWDSIC